ncbi:hypothetical protein [Leucobacter denitrificans]|uniref:Integral membrane protein n=1 Tax=Leucobacter denitrificans TaxID=683042 RepID=A0A7G9S6J9_9MICO|nr:hypothetical protein [Leucobacter denitrificans]QNN63474.1 hypothetical protein H9L06_03905 [Leucobacter denitrificans]
MEILKGILLVLHIIGFGAVFGSTLAQLMNVKKGTAKVANGIMHGALLLLVTGLALVGMVYATGGSPDNAKIGVKLLVLIALFVVVLMNRKKEQASGGVLGAIAGLAALNVAIAVLW